MPKNLKRSIVTISDLKDQLRETERAGASMLEYDVDDKEHRKLYRRYKSAAKLINSPLTDILQLAINAGLLDTWIIDGSSDKDEMIIFSVTSVARSQDEIGIMLLSDFFEDYRDIGDDDNPPSFIVKKALRRATKL
jgi:hypothetical protein